MDILFTLPTLKPRLFSQRSREGGWVGGNSGGKRFFLFFLAPHTLSLTGSNLKEKIKTTPPSLHKRTNTPHEEKRKKKKKFL
jgi:hypothetical protein